VGREDLLRVMYLWDMGAWVFMRRRNGVLLLLIGRYSIQQQRQSFPKRGQSLQYSILLHVT
jgi:hypothetical protein